MKRTLATLAALPLLAGSLLAVAAPAHADDRSCRGSIGAESIDDNLVVPKGATCVLTGTRIEGNVEVKKGGVLRAYGITVDGNIQGEGHQRVAVRPHDGKRSVVEGNIQLKNARKGGTILRTVVDGDIQLFSNRGRHVVRGNVVDGNLQCKGNKPAPRGKNNRVEGNKEDQCRRL